MAHPRGSIFWEMLPRFDIVADNLTPHVMRSWGITLETLSAKRPGVIWASISGYGSTGPFAEYLANGPTAEPMAGPSSIHGYDGDPGANTGGPRTRCVPMRTRRCPCANCTAPGFLDTSLAVIMQPLRCWARAPGGRRPGCGGRDDRPATSGCSGP